MPHLKWILSKTWDLGSTSCTHTTPERSTGRKAHVSGCTAHTPLPVCLSVKVSEVGGTWFVTCERAGG